MTTPSPPRAGSGVAGLDDMRPSPRTPMRGLVRIAQADDGADFITDAGPVVPRGVGSYPLLEHAGRGRADHIEDIFAQAIVLGRPLIRTNAFFMGGRNPGRLRDDDAKVRPEGLLALDRVLAAAAEHDIKLILPVANNWEDYGGAAAIARALLGEPITALLPAALTKHLPGASGKDRFYTHRLCLDAQRDFIGQLVRRRNSVNGRDYATDDTIFAWELCNEARFELSVPGYATRLADWASTMRSAFRDAGATQLVGWGGSGHRGVRGEDLDVLLRARAFDFATLHLYPFLVEPALLNIESRAERARAAGVYGAKVISDRAALCRTAGVPLLVEEHGWKTGEHTAHEERASVMGAFMRAARSEGVGTLPWMIAERGRPDYDRLLIRPEHAPEWTVLKTW